jgi:glutaredoxin
MKITIYSTTNCAACHSLTDWLTKLGQQYDLKIVDADPELMAEFMAASEGKIGVPFTVLTDGDGKQTKISGFDMPKFKTVLAIH